MEVQPAVEVAAGGKLAHAVAQDAALARPQLVDVLDLAGARYSAKLLAAVRFSWM